MLTNSSLDREDMRPAFSSGAGPMLVIDPADRGFHVAPAHLAFGGVPPALRGWGAQPVPRRRTMRLPALLGAFALHIAGVASILVVEWSVAPPVALPAITVSLSFEPAPQSAPADAPSNITEPAPAAAPPPDETAPPPVASEPPPPIAAALPEAAPAAVPAPPRPSASTKTPTKVLPKPRLAQHRASPSLPGAVEPSAAAPPAASPAPAPAASPPALTAAMPIVPPRPVDLAQGNRKPVYPALARSRGLQGTVLLRVDVTPSGTPLAVTVATSSGHALLDDAAVAAVKTWRFSPATQAGVPVAAFADVPVQFRMAD